MQNKDIITVTSPLMPDLEEFHELLKDIWDRRWITNNGHYHQLLENALAEYLKVPYVSLFTNGTMPLPFRHYVSLARSSPRPIRSSPPPTHCGGMASNLCSWTLSGQQAAWIPIRLRLPSPPRPLPSCPSMSMVSPVTSRPSKT